MSENNNERSQRIEHLKQLTGRGIDVYPAATKRTHEIGKILDLFKDLEKEKKEVVLAGRVLSLREHGGSTFSDCDDGTGTMQIYFKKDELSSSELTYNDVTHALDVGDFIEVSGIVFTTKKGEETLLVSSWRFLTKAIRPIPSKWYGIKDEETRYRKRYLDMLLDPKLRDVFKRKAVFWNSMREFLIKKGFLEVFTPILENTPGGADAEPFMTHHNALDIDVYLRISMGELWQKRLMVAGYPKTFEIGRQFRNEGISPEHLQDYMQMEYYMAYADYKVGMKLTRDLIRHVAKKTFGTLEFTIDGKKVDLGKPWKQIDFSREVKKQTGINPPKAKLEDIQKWLKEKGVTHEEGLERGRLIDLVWKQCRKNIVGPAYLVGAPVALSPLAKKSTKNPETTERFQLILSGSELCNGYSELNDPLDQHERFEEQMRLREAGDTEAQMHDASFVEALEYGMPPVCGLGISERLFSFLESKSIRECVMFPLLRPRYDQKDQAESGVKAMPAGNETGKEEVIKDIGITRDEALTLLREYIKNENLIKHHLSVECQMKALADHFTQKGEKRINRDAWGMAGLLHDMDWEKTESTPEKHSIMSSEVLNKKGVHPAIVNSIRVHNHTHRIEPKTLMERALYTAEELTGIVTAAALVRPDKKLASVKVKSIIKKFKDKSFARGVNRDIILKSKEYLGLELNELTEITLKAMQGIAEELGL